MTRGSAGQVVLWAETIKLSHTVFALPFALGATFLAGRDLPGRDVPYAGQIGLIALCMFFARSVAMTFNRIADAAIDSRNPRTAHRAMATGEISKPVAWGFLTACAAGFVVSCYGFQVGYRNPWPVRLALPVLVVVCSYSLTKRFTRWTHFYLGGAIALSPVAAWVAISPETVGWPAVVLMGAVLFWIGGFDIIYACQDIGADRREGLHSLPARWGPGRALLVVRAAHVVTVGLLIGLGVLAELGWVYFAGVGLVAVLLAVENSLVRADDFSRVNVAFFTVNGAVSLLLGILLIVDVVMGAGPAFDI